MDSEETIELSTLEKTICVLAGPAIGMLPAEMQMKIGELTNNPFQAASYMSTTSRLFNGVLAISGGVALAARMFGIDIDPTAYNSVTWAAIPLAVSTVLREAGYALKYETAGGKQFMTATEPHGEFFLSLGYGLIHKEKS